MSQVSSFVERGRLVRMLWIGLCVSALLAFCAWVYAPGLRGPALLDDVSNIAGASSPSALGAEQKRVDFFDYVTANDSGPLGRPVSMASFYVESWFEAPRTLTGKRINLLLHCLNGLLLYLFLLRVLRLMGVYSTGAVFFATAFWLLAPLHLSAVLYHVQRMTLLATFFGLLFLHSWLSWRLAYGRDRASWWPAIRTLLVLLLAVGAKENAVVLVPLALLLEVMCLATAGETDARVRRWSLLSRRALLLGGVVSVAAFAWAYGWVVDGYAIRHFSLGERLLTESRILFDYASQLFWPDVARMGLSHDDVVLSHSVMSPPSTLFSLTALLALPVGLACFWRFPAFRGIAFGVVFFLVAHSIESSVLALELYFEHRNYLPSIGLVFSLAIIFATINRALPKSYIPILLAGVLLLAVHSARLSSQAMVWSDRTSIVLTELAAHPESSRANVAMSVLLARAGDSQGAMRYSETAMRVSPVETGADHALRFSALSCLADSDIEDAWYSSQGPVRTLNSSSAQASLQQTVRWAETAVCPNLNYLRLADFFYRSIFAEDPATPVDTNILAAALRIERSLGREERVERYLGLLKERN